MTAGTSEGESLQINAPIIVLTPRDPLMADAFTLSYSLQRLESTPVDIPMNPRIPLGTGLFLHRDHHTAHGKLVTGYQSKSCLQTRKPKRI
jgi:hypothetical protein